MTYVSKLYTPRQLAETALELLEGYTARGEYESADALYMWLLFKSDLPVTGIEADDATGRGHCWRTQHGLPVRPLAPDIASFRKGAPPLPDDWQPRRTYPDGYLTVERLEEFVNSPLWHRPRLPKEG